MSVRHPVWKSLEFQNLGYSFETMSRHFRENNLFFYGTGDNVSPRGTVSPQGFAHLFLLSTEDLGLAEKPFSYLELLVKAKGYGLSPARPCIAPQLHAVYVDQPIGEVLLIASEPKELGYSAKSGKSFGIFAVGKQPFGARRAHRYIEVRLLPPPDEVVEFEPDDLWVFEL